MRTRFNVLRMLLGLALCLAFPASLKAQAAFPATVSPLNVDQAVHIVIGELVRFEPTDEKWNPKVHLGKAVVLVKETLKGPPSGTVSFIAQTWTDPSYKPQQPLRIHQVGMKGIWMVFTNGWGLNHGALPESLRADVLQTLKILEERTWSDEVHGLRLWAGLWRSGSRGDRTSFLVALKNTSDAPIYYPVDEAQGILTVTARSADCTVYGRAAHLWSKGDAAYCRKIEAGEVIYLQRGMTRESFDWDWLENESGKSLALPTGRYQATVTFRNDRDGYIDGGARVRRPVPTWKGELHAPSVQLVVDPPEKSRLPGRSDADVSADGPPS